MGSINPAQSLFPSTQGCLKSLCYDDPVNARRKPLQIWNNQADGRRLRNRNETTKLQIQLLSDVWYRCLELDFCSYWPYFRLILFLICMLFITTIAPPQSLQRIKSWGKQVALPSFLISHFTGIIFFFILPHRSYFRETMLSPWVLGLSFYVTWSRDLLCMAWFIAGWLKIISHSGD